MKRLDLGLGFALVVAVLVLVVVAGRCQCGLGRLDRCEPDSAELAELTYQAVQLEAAKRGRCVLVCYADTRRLICPDLDSGAES